MGDPSFFDLSGSVSSPLQRPNGDERTLAIIVHVLSIFFWIVPGLVVYIVKKDESPFVADHAREALNFQISMSILYVVLLVSLVGILFLWVPWLIQLVACIVAAIRASEEKLYRYPFTLRLIK